MLRIAQNSVTSFWRYEMGTVAMSGGSCEVSPIQNMKPEAENNVNPKPRGLSDHTRIGRTSRHTINESWA